ncbi:MAG: helix-turn-helix domain-containing protein [Solimonas sp.]
MPRSRKSRYAQEYRELLELLVELRNDAGVTQVELAERIGTSQSVLSKLERGVVRMDLMDVLDYLDGIHADPKQFIGTFLSRIEWKPAASRKR